jgi:hypothetical protein
MQQFCTNTSSIPASCIDRALLARQLAVVLTLGRGDQGAAIKLLAAAVLAGGGVLLLAAHRQGKLTSPWQYIRSFWRQLRASFHLRSTELSASNGLPCLVNMF